MMRINLLTMQNTAKLGVAENPQYPSGFTSYSAEKSLRVKFTKQSQDNICYLKFDMLMHFVLISRSTISSYPISAY